MNKPKAYSYTRMSTLEQLKGDSSRRQLARTEKYAEQNGLEIVDRFDDWGVSAFHGRNADFGALSEFKQRVESGDIKKGSYLIVESMDRLSRQRIIKALSLLTEIVSNGIILVTLDDNQVYSEENIAANGVSLIIALSQMARAHEESKRKSGMLSDAWEEKRRKAREHGVVSTSKVPGWLIVKDGKVLEAPGRAAIVREIFTLTRDGCGAYTVCRLLNERGQPVWSKRKNAIWRESYIKKIIGSRTVLGEYQPHRLVHSDSEGTKRVPEGAPIIGYYPAVVSLQLFMEANAATDCRRTGGRGRKGIRYANLFSGLLKCFCGAGYRYIDKGPAPKGGQYLQCSVAYLKGECQVKAIRYEVIEHIMLSFVETLDIARVLGGESTLSMVEQKRSLLFSKRDEYAQVDLQITNIADAIASGEGVQSSSLMHRLVKLESKLESLQNEINATEREVNDLIYIDPSKRKSVIDDLLSRIRDKNGAETVPTRRALVGELQRMLKKITVTPNVRLAWEIMDSNADWQELYNVQTVADLEKKCRELSFDLLLVYRNGDTARIDALDGPFFRGKGNRKMKDWNYLARAEQTLSG